MESKIDISVIIPMHNSAKYIEKAIDSILLQEKHGFNYEIIVVDDFSKDDSCELVKGLKNDKIKLIELNQNQGTANARNAGIKIAKGEWIQFLDSDDTVCKDLYKKFELSIMPIFNCYLFSILNEYSKYTVKQTITTIKDKRAFGFFSVIWNKFIKREICLEFVEVSKQNEDSCFIIDMMNNRDLQMALIQDAYYIYNRKNDLSKMANFNKQEYMNMFNYIYSKIKVSDKYTKMFILDVFGNLIFARNIPLQIRIPVALKTITRLFNYLPAIYKNGIGYYTTQIIISE